MIKLMADSGKVYKAYEDEDPFYSFFLNDICLRPSCYHCHFKENNSKADITIGDFWGASKVIPNFGREGELSLVLLHTEKAKAIFNTIRKDMEIQQTEYEKSVENNSAYMKSVARPEERDCFYKDLENMPFCKMIKKYHKRTVQSRVRRVLEKLHLLSVARMIKRAIKV